MKQYLELMEEIMLDGEQRADRTGVGTLSVFGRQLHFNLEEGFPLVTTKEVSFRNVILELLWFLKGHDNVKYLQAQGVHIWDEWAAEDGRIGPMYGVQWRAWPMTTLHKIDQIQQVIDQIRSNPKSRRHIVSAWNPAYLPDERYSPKYNVECGAMALAPCHCFFQFYVGMQGLSCHVYQRSADLFLGVPYNIASYAALTHMIAAVCNLRPHELIYTFGDVHIYTSHIQRGVISEQLSRTPKELPVLEIPAYESINTYDWLDFTLINYHPWGRLTAPIAV